MSAVDFKNFIYTARYPLYEPFGRVHAYVRDTYNSPLPTKITPCVLEVIRRIAVAVMAPFAYLITGCIALFAPFYSVDHPKLNWDAPPKSIVVLSTENPRYHSQVQKFIKIFEQGTTPVSSYFWDYDKTFKEISNPSASAKDETTLVILDCRELKPRYLNSEDGLHLVEPLKDNFPHIQKVIVCYQTLHPSYDAQEILIQGKGRAVDDSFWTSFKEIYTYHMEMRSPYAREQFVKALNLTPKPS